MQPEFPLLLFAWESIPVCFGWLQYDGREESGHSVQSDSEKKGGAYLKFNFIGDEALTREEMSGMIALQ